MNEFTAEELFEAIDREVRDVLDRHNVLAPPVDAEQLAQEEFDLTVREQDPDDDQPEPGRFGPRAPRRPNFREVVVRPDMTDEARQATCAKACAKGLIPRVFARLKVPVDPSNRSAQSQLVGFIVPRLLLPTKWFGRDARKSGWDLFELKDVYPTAGYMLIALRMLDVCEEPCVVAVVDDGVVGLRRGNMQQASKKLTRAEELAAQQALSANKPAKVRRDGWTAWAWPASGGPYNRVILRSVPDEL